MSMHTSYKRYIGKATNIKVKTSGGVMIAETIKIIIFIEHCFNI